MARIELQRVSKDILKYVTDESYHELIDMAKYQITAIEELEREHVKYIKILTKLHRWLGWFQGVFTSFGATTLDEMKNLNKNS